MKSKTLDEVQEHKFLISRCRGLVQSCVIYDNVITFNIGVEIDGHMFYQNGSFGDGEYSFNPHSEPKHKTKEIQDFIRTNHKEIFILLCRLCDTSTREGE